MPNTIKTRREFQAWQKEFDALAPKVGDVAPDFELCDAGGKNPVRLSEFRDQKPVALVFGSYT